MVYDVLNYIKQCPYLSDYIMNVDFLGKNINSLSVSGRAKQETIKTYIDGDCIVKEKYILKLRLPYGVDMDENLKNSELLTNISKWFFYNNERGILPELAEDKIAISASADFLRDEVTHLADTAVYTAEIVLVYYKTRSL